jgi:hypothetical protein
MRDPGSGPPDRPARFPSCVSCFITGSHLRPIATAGSYSKSRPFVIFLNEGWSEIGFVRIANRTNVERSELVDDINKWVKVLEEKDWERMLDCLSLGLCHLFNDHSILAHHDRNRIYPTTLIPDCQ